MQIIASPFVASIRNVHGNIDMKVLTVAQGKGGVGKTTLAVNLACVAQHKGLKAVVVELDRQGTASSWFERRGKTPEVVPSSGVELAKTLKSLKAKKTDLVIIDLPGTHTPSAVWAIREADFVLIPGRPNEVDMEAAESTVRTVADEEKDSAFVITFSGATSPKAKKTRKDLEALGLEVAPGAVRNHKDFEESVNKGFGVIERFKKSNSAQDVLNLWTWLAKRMEISK